MERVSGPAGRGSRREWCSAQIRAKAAASKTQPPIAIKKFFHPGVVTAFQTSFFRHFGVVRFPGFVRERKLLRLRMGTERRFHAF
jgi:hypothetical protein